MQFEKLFEIQKKFTERFFREKHDMSIEDVYSDQATKVKWNKEYILSLTKEVYEMLDELDWKMHHKKDDDDVRDNFLEEGVDVLKYLLGTFIINGFTAEEIFEKFVDKSRVVEAKFKQEKAIEEIKNNGKETVFIDIDGVLATWPNDYINFVNTKLNKNYATLPELKGDVDKKLQYDLKSEYRLNGSKRNLGVIEGAKKFLKQLKQCDLNIVLLTARPYKKYFRIYSDTLEWLLKHELEYDCIIFDEEKEKYIINKFYNNGVKFIVEDQIDNAKKLANNGFKVYLRFNKGLYKDNIKQRDVEAMVKYTTIKVIKGHKEIIECQFA